MGVAAAVFLSAALSSCSAELRSSAIRSDTSPPEEHGLAAGKLRPASAEEAPRAPSPPRLAGGARSEWELAQWVLQALKDRNAELLQSLRVTESEYKEHIFPEFPEAKGTIPVDFHWFHLNVRSYNGIQDAIQRYGGLELELLDVLPKKGITQYATYEMWNRVSLVVRFPNDEIQEIRVFGSLVHMDGVWKILGFPS